ncbi:MAG: DUF4214 domain-containing protein [Clostridiales bacterium]|nr:DUF4214 domain-containing protein [Clostridiales bacterium]
MRRVLLKGLAVIAAVVMIINIPCLTSAVSAAPNSGAGELVTRLYNYALGRNPDEAGYADWCNQLLYGQINGAEVASGILFSDEYTNLATDNASYVNTLYHVFFNREPDPVGAQVWTTALEQGVGRREIMMGFVNSSEWANVCALSGIYSGSTAEPTVQLEVSEESINFVSNLNRYFSPTSRSTDEIVALATDLTYLRTSCRQIASDFIFSQSFITSARASSPGKTVETFFKAFEGREPLPAEANALCSAMNGNLNLDYLYNYFVNRNNFASRCVNRGLMPGKIVEVNTAGISDSAVRSYFNDAAFVGNSVTAGFPMYFDSVGRGLLGNVSVYARVSYSFLTDMNSMSGYMLQYEDVELQAAELLRLANIRKVFISMGTNDLVSAEADVVSQRYIDYINGIISSNPGIRVFVVSTTPRCDSAQTPGLTNEKIDALNELMSSYCSQNNLDFIDINTPLKNGTDQLYPDYSSDGYVHMNNTGYGVWSSAISSYVRTMLAGERHIYRYQG